MLTQRDKLALALTQAIYDTIRESGDNGAPTGVMYAAMMGHLSLEQFQGIINVLTRAGLITVEHHVARIVKKG